MKQYYSIMISTTGTTILNSMFVLSITLLLLSNTCTIVSGRIVGPSTYNDHPSKRRTLQDVQFSTEDEEGVHGQYIFKFVDSVKDPADKMNDMIRSSSNSNEGTKVLWEYTSTFVGVCVANVTHLLLEDLMDDPSIDSVEQDIRYYLDSTTTVALGSNEGSHYMPWSWGLDRIDEQVSKLKYDDIYHYDFTGKGINAVIMDTGIRKTHSDFQSQGQERVFCAFNAFQHETGESCHDEIGHGTFIAGIIGGMISGVAKKVDLINVKVVRSSDGFLSVGSVLAGLDFVLTQKLFEPETPMVVNLSIGGPRRDSINESIKVLYHNNVFVVASAGNEGNDACSKSPASAEKCITVASSNYNDTVSSFSNYGYCVDIHAPGHNITSSYIRSDTDIVTLSGTSMAAAHVSGVIALILEAFPDASPSDVYNNLLDNAFKDVLTNVKEGSPNLLLQTIDGDISK